MKSRSVTIEWFADQAFQNYCEGNVHCYMSKNMLRTLLALDHELDGYDKDEFEKLISAETVHYNGTIIHPTPAAREGIVFSNAPLENSEVTKAAMQEEGSDEQ